MDKVRIEQHNSFGTEHASSEVSSSLPAGESWRKHRAPCTARGGPRHDSHHARTLSG